MRSTSFETLIKSLNPHSLIDASISKKDYVPLDLSISNSDLLSYDLSSSEALEDYILSHLRKNNAKVAFGGYIERRGIYNRSKHFNRPNPEEERNIHLGLDIWIAAGTPIFAPLDGLVHSFNNNTNYGDYGPTIILQHSIENHKFYTLYGHLSVESISNLEVGLEVKRGDKFASLGTSKVNGDYSPHLHFQIIKDIQNQKGDYPGVCNQIDLEFYKNNCPDPQLLFKLN
ncbi:MAG: peptidoglycan DD-metalloendopeptidase family protein [Winogradskyella sp.]|nr:peptidoglycan DD-metalloendopeptidase family protein [Winogradskyella sp.]